MGDQEEVLHGGFMSTVSRVGETVRRAATPAGPTIQRLLAHVRGRGFEWAPEPLGLDDRGREVLAFIAGEVPHEMPAWVWSDQVLADVAVALRRWHDASLAFDLRDAVWNFVTPGTAEVICHNDFATYNCVFQQGRLVGVIDYDLCAPGPRLWDIAYTAYRFVSLMPGPDADSSIGGERSPFPRAEAKARLDSFLKSYSAAGEPLVYEGSQVIQTAIERLFAIARWTDNYVETSGISALEPHSAMYRAHAAWLGTWEIG